MLHEVKDSFCEEEADAFSSWTDYATKMDSTITQITLKLMD